MSKQFVNAAVESVKEDAAVEITYDWQDVITDQEGKILRTVECKAYQPTEGQIALLFAMIGDNSGWRTRTEGVVNFFLEMMDDETRAHYATRLMRHNDAFDIDGIKDILMWLIEEWDGKPYPRAVRVHWIAIAHYDSLVAHYYDIDLMRLKPSKFLSLAYGWALKHLSFEGDRMQQEMKFEQWKAELDMPLPGDELVESEESLQRDYDLFLGAMG